MRPWVPAVLACALVSCASGSEPSTLPSSTTPPAATTSAATIPPVVTPTPAVTSPAAPKTDLADGRHYGILKVFDPKKRILLIDVVQFLTGEAAEKAAREDGEEAYDYYVRNQNTRVRVLGYAASAPIVVNTLTAEETGSSTKDTQVTEAKFASYFAKGEAQQRMFYVTIAGGVVTKINEQFLP